MPRPSRPTRKRLPDTPVVLPIHRLSHEGRGVGDIDGKVAFVEGALPGETVEARYQQNKSRFAELSLTQILTASPQRVAPACVAYERCGGCVLQHLDSAGQIEFKQAALLEKLRHQAGIDLTGVTVLPPLQSVHYHYRRKARLGARYVMRKGGTLVGFRERHGSFIAEMDACPVLVDCLDRLIRPLRALIDGLSIRLELPQIEVAAGETAADPDAPLRAALVFRHLQPFTDPDLKCLEDFGTQWDCDMYLQPGGVQTIHKLWPAATPERLYYHLPTFDLRFAFHPTDFTQVNGTINRALVPRAVDLLEVQPGDRVLDLFCGLGNFTLPLARRAAAVVGIEGSADMVARAEENATANAIDNARFFAADLSQPTMPVVLADQTFARVLLDPPRSGAAEVIEWLPALGAQRLVYISCNPSTLARDVGLLVAQGYVLRQTGVMDMFPHTAHVESIAVLDRIPPR